MLEKESDTVPRWPRGATVHHVVNDDNTVAHIENPAKDRHEEPQSADDHLAASPRGLERECKGGAEAKRGEERNRLVLRCYHDSRAT